MGIFYQQLINGIVLGSIYALPAIGVSMIYGILKVMNFAQGDIYMVGAFMALTACTSLGSSYLAALVFSMLIMSLFGIVFERLAVRPLPKTALLYIVISTLATSTILQNAALLIWGPDPRLLQSPFTGQIIRLGSLSFSIQHVFVMIVGAVLMVLVQLFMSRTTLGWAVRAVAQDTQAAALMGINVNRVVAIAFMISSALAAAAGTLVSPSLLVSPSMGRLTGLKIIAAVLLGGIGSIPGAMAGGLLLGLAESMTVSYIGSMYQDIVAFLFVIAAMLLRPQGLFGRKQN